MSQSHTETHADILLRLYADLFGNAIHRQLMVLMGKGYISFEVCLFKTWGNWGELCQLLQNIFCLITDPSFNANSCH